MNNPRLKKIADARKAVKAAPTLAEKQEIYLNFISAFFNTNNRSSQFKTMQSHCYYYSDTNLGCAIGIFLTPQTAKFLDKKYFCKPLNQFLNSSITSVVHSPRKTKIPKWMRDLDTLFLNEIQSLHDDYRNWTETGLSSVGKIKVADIKKQFKLK